VLHVRASNPNPPELCLCNYPTCVCEEEVPLVVSHLVALSLCVACVCIYARVCLYNTCVCL